MATARKANKKPVVVSHTCTNCGYHSTSEGTLVQKFYVSNSKFTKHKRTQLCKDCCIELSIMKNSLSRLKLRDVLRFIDKPYLESLINSSINEAIKGLDGDINNDEATLKYGKEIVSAYFKTINSLPQYKTLSYKDSDSESSMSDFSYETENESEIITDKIRMFWGKGKDDWEYEFLQDEIYKLKTSFECNDYGMEMILKDIAYINLDIHKLRISDNDPTKLIESRSKLMDKGKLNPIQQTGADANEQVTFGTLIQKFENERPIPEASETWKDPDNFKFWDTIFAGHLAKMNDLSGVVIDEYEEIIKPYTVERNSGGDE